MKRRIKFATLFMTFTLVMQVLPIKVNAATDEDFWRSMSTTYYYDQLTSNEKKLYDRIDSVYMGILLSKETYTINDCVVQYSDLNLGLFQADKVSRLYLQSNPQVYFLEEKGSYVTVGSLFYNLRDEFLDGESRSDFTESFKEGILKLNSDAANRRSGNLPEQIEKSVHDVIVETTDYAEWDYDQFPISVVLYHNSVCAGYSRAFQLLMNMNGVDCIEMTSTAHAWNGVNLHGEWYLVDCTNDDVPEGTAYKYYNTSSAFALSTDSSIFDYSKYSLKDYYPVLELDRAVVGRL